MEKKDVPMPPDTKKPQALPVPAFIFPPVPALDIKQRQGKVPEWSREVSKGGLDGIRTK
jgi:hypothetical protein